MVKMAVKIAANRMVMLAVVCALVACGKSEDTSTTGAAASGAAVKPSLSVQLVRPLKQDWPLTLTAHGAIAPWQEAVIGAEVSGLRLMDVLVNVGDGVRKGQLLASLRADSLQADLAASRASVAEAQALLQEAQANAERARSLRQSDAVSAQEAQRALTGEQTAQARVDALKAQVASNELRLAQSR
ncbi:MAG TPA: biotin/lipoyl-binding protein, partial [Aquabacterium sp.]|nr:biotin/lipoyl-binding protein [Aquabacterium sp.]